MLLAKESCPPKFRSSPWGAAYVQWLVNAGVKGLFHIPAPNPTPASILDNSERYPSYKAPCRIGWSFCCNRKNSSPQLLFQKMLFSKPLACVSLLVYFWGIQLDIPLTLWLLHEWGKNTLIYYLSLYSVGFVCSSTSNFTLIQLLRSEKQTDLGIWKPESSFFVCLFF